LIEQETKLTLSAEDYRRIREKGTVLECREQLNIYLHDPSRLEQGLGYFRVRFESGREPVATVKIPVSWEGGVRKMVELERPLREMGPALFPRPRRTVLVEGQLPGEIGRYFQELGITRIRRLGWMRNRRCLVDVGEGIVELDRTRLPGGIYHHEVEIETENDESRRVLTAVIRSWAPSATESTIGKFSRFLESVQRLL
jgi:hypothetical protein